jgi:hypothetical protein
MALMKMRSGKARFWKRAEFVGEENDMTSLKCDLCEHVADGETFDDWMMALRPHYMEAHADVMNDSTRGKEEMEAWMKDNRARFDAA